MKIALAHDWFNTKIGGAERVILELADLFPQAPIYTLMFNDKQFTDLIDRSRIHTSWLQFSPSLLRKRPRYWLPLLPAAVRSLDFSGYDVILSSSFGYVKNLQRPQGSYHICYCHTPLRAVWDYSVEYIKEQPVDPIQKLVGRKIAHQIKKWDVKGSAGVNKWIANSGTVAERIKNYYDKTATIVYPPVATSDFKPVKYKNDYYLTASMLSPYKKVELVIKAFNATGRPLVVIGQGSQYKYLKKLAKANIKLLGYVDEAHKRRLMASARGLIYPNHEDFGIAPVEAMAAGTPVVAYQAGGVTETVIDGKTGVLFKDQSAGGINQAIERLEKLKLRTADMVVRAKVFDRAQFRSRILGIVEVAKQHVEAN